MNTSPWFSRQTHQNSLDRNCLIPISVSRVRCSSPFPLLLRFSSVTHDSMSPLKGGRALCFVVVVVLGRVGSLDPPLTPSPAIRIPQPQEPLHSLMTSDRFRELRKRKLLRQTRSNRDILYWDCIFWLFLSCSGLRDIFKYPWWF